MVTCEVLARSLVGAHFAGCLLHSEMAVQQGHPIVNLSGRVQVSPWDQVRVAYVPVCLPLVISQCAPADVAAVVVVVCGRLAGC